METATNVSDFVKRINTNSTIDLEILPVELDGERALVYFWKSGVKESNGFATELDAVYDFLDSIKNWDFCDVFDDDDDDDDDDEF